MIAFIFHADAGRTAHATVKYTSLSAFISQVWLSWFIVFMKP